MISAAASPDAFDGRGEAPSGQASDGRSADPEQEGHRVQHQKALLAYGQRRGVCQPQVRQCPGGQQILALAGKRAADDLPRERDQQQDHRQAQRHPAEERHLDPRQLPEIADRQRVGARARRRPHAADQRPPTDGDQEAPAEVRAPAILAGPFEDVPGRAEQDGCGGDGVDPHGQPGAGRQRQQDEPLGPPAREQQDPVADALPQAHFHKPDREQEHAQKEQDHRVAQSLAGDLARRGHSESRKEQEHDQPGCGKGDRLGDPEDQAERDDGQADATLRAQRDQLAVGLPGCGQRQQQDGGRARQGQQYEEPAPGQIAHRFSTTIAPRASSAPASDRPLSRSPQISVLATRLIQSRPRRRPRTPGTQAGRIRPGAPRCWRPAPRNRAPLRSSDRGRCGRRPLTHETPKATETR